MTELTIHREGDFLHKHLPGGKCGREGQVQYLYKASITVEGDLRPPQYFIVDNNTIQAYWEDRYKAPAKGISCELMAQQAVEDLWGLVEREGQDRTRGTYLTYFEVKACCVMISGNGGVSWLECKRTR